VHKQDESEELRKVGKIGADNEGAPRTSGPRPTHVRSGSSNLGSRRPPNTRSASSLKRLANWDEKKKQLKWAIAQRGPQYLPLVEMLWKEGINSLENLAETEWEDLPLVSEVEFRELQDIGHRATTPGRRYSVIDEEERNSMEEDEDDMPTDSPFLERAVTDPGDTTPRRGSVVRTSTQVVRMFSSTRKLAPKRLSSKLHEIMTRPSTDDQTDVRSVELAPQRSHSSREFDL